MSTHFILIRALSRSARQISSWLSFFQGWIWKKSHELHVSLWDYSQSPVSREGDDTGWDTSRLTGLFFSSFPSPSLSTWGAFCWFSWFMCMSDRELCSLFNTMPGCLVMHWGRGGEEGVGSKTPNQQIRCFTNSRFSTSLVPHTGILHF